VQAWHGPAQDSEWFASRADLQAALGLLRPDFDEAFARYAEETTIRVANGDSRRWAAYRGSEGAPYLDWYGLAELFNPDRDLHVFALGDAFVSRICGNYSETEVRWGAVSVAKFSDADMDGNPDAGEADPGFPVVLTGTASNGESVGPLYDTTPCTFGHLPPGHYVVRENVTWSEHRLVSSRRVTTWGGKRWMATTPVSYEFDLGYAEETQRVFGNVQLGSIVGVKWDDASVDGAHDPDELTVEAWPLRLTGTWRDGTVPPVEDVVTAPDGTHTFLDLPPGAYLLAENVEPSTPCQIVELLDARWRATHPLDTERRPTWRYDIVLGPGDPWAADEFGNVRLGSIIKEVLDYWWREPIADVLIRLEDGAVEDRVIPQCPSLPREGRTGADGTVEFADLLPSVNDDYELIVYVPDGWLPQPNPGYPDNTIWHHIGLKEGDTVERTNYIYDNPRREPRTLGFWINWRLRYTDAEMAALIVRVKKGSQDFSTLSLATIDKMLDPSKAKTARQMATIQYLALWLNLASDRLGFLPQVNLTGIYGWNRIIADDDGIMTMHELMLQMRQLFNAATMTPKQWEIFKNICDAINNYRVFLEPPTGPID
jgi:hypothetical protein